MQLSANFISPALPPDASGMRTSLSVCVPVYDEQYLVETSLRRLAVLADSPLLTRLQVIVVDDCSGDETPRVLERFRKSLPADPSGKMDWHFYRHERNQGKGAALRTAIEHAECDLTVVHDADLEYHPRDLLQMLPLFLQENADAVFGSRFMAGGFKRALFFKHSVGNHLLTFLCDLASDLNLTDMETCYKMVRTDLLKTIPLVSRDFRIEPELTIKLAKRGAQIFEVPISYSGRTYQEGKKIGWKDGFRALGAIVRFKVSDLICKPDEYGSEVAVRLGRAPNYTRWLADLLRPHLGSSVLEIGAGKGNLLLHLIPRKQYWACDANPLFVRELRKLIPTRPYLGASAVDPADPSSLPAEQNFDTVICQNVLEHVEDDAAVLRGIARVVRDDGKIIVLVPNSPSLLGAIDRSLGHRRRYTRDSLRRLADQAGMHCVSITAFNRACSLPWWISGRILRRRRFSLLQVKWVNWMTPILRKLDPYLPLPPLSLIAVIEKLRPSGRTELEAPTDELAAPLRRG
ncbi:MAG: bifunctional glycosyltransferase/class I SAM-dependent methyltransferase [Terriglobales bacterium]|jgi:SAM-dependent methyltransferase